MFIGDRNLCTCVHMVAYVICGSVGYMCAWYVSGVWVHMKVCACVHPSSLRGKPSAPQACLPAWERQPFLCLSRGHNPLAKVMLCQAGARAWSVIKYTDRPRPILSSGSFQGRKVNSAPAQEQQVHSKQSPQGDAKVIEPYKTTRRSSRSFVLPFTRLFSRKKKKSTQCKHEPHDLGTGRPRFRSHPGCF